MKKPPERRSELRQESETATELSWEDKVLKRVGKHLTHQSQSDKDLGWEAAGFNVLKSHVDASDDDAKE
jgi:hypothetical protein